jgi:hypothetical protein
VARFSQRVRQPLHLSFATGQKFVIPENHSSISSHGVVSISMTIGSIPSRYKIFMFGDLLRPYSSFWGIYAELLSIRIYDIYAELLPIQIYPILSYTVKKG